MRPLVWLSGETLARIQSANGWSGLHKGRNALCSMGIQRESEVSLGHGGIGGVGTLS